jgi:hypothetical protein
MYTSILTMPAVSESKRVDTIFDGVDEVLRENTYDGIRTALASALEKWGVKYDK